MLLKKVKQRTKSFLTQEIQETLWIVSVKGGFLLQNDSLLKHWERDLLTDRWHPVQRAEVKAIWLQLGSEESRTWHSLRYSIGARESCKTHRTGAERRWENKSKRNWRRVEGAEPFPRLVSQADINTEQTDVWEKRVYVHRRNGQGLHVSSASFDFTLLQWIRWCEFGTINVLHW